MREEIEKKLNMEKEAERKLQDANYSDDSWSSSDDSGATSGEYSEEHSSPVAVPS